jgi:hypothetical protein
MELIIYRVDFSILCFIFKPKVRRKGGSVENKAKKDSLGVKRVGATAEDQLRWVVEFAQKDMKLLRSEERVALGKDLRLLVPDGWEGIEKMKPMDEATVARLHSHISQGIKDLLDSNSGKWRLPRIAGLTLCRSEPPTRYQLTGEGGEFEGVVLGVFNLILRLGSRLKACDSPACGKPFVATRRQEYCSMTCSQRERDKRRTA